MRCHHGRTLILSVPVLFEHFVSSPSPVPVRLSPSQGRQDPSLPSPCTGYGNPRGESDEPVLAESAISSFLGSLRSAGIAVPLGLAIVDRSARLSSEAAPPAASQAGLSARSSSQVRGGVGLGL